MVAPILEWKMRASVSIMIIAVIFLLSVIPFSSSEAGSFCKTDKSTFPTYTKEIKPWETIQISGRNGTDYKSAAKWIVTTRARNLSLLISKLNLQGRPCIGNNSNRSPIFTIRIYEDATYYQPYQVCAGRSVSKPFVSTNRIEIMYCNGVQGDTFQFDVTAKIGGMLRAFPTTPQQRKMESRKVEQWLLLVASHPSEGLIIHFTIATLKRGSGGGCRRGFITIKDRTNHSLLPNGEQSICNRRSTTLKKQYKIVTGTNEANISFKNAQFTVSYQSAPQSKIMLIKRTETTTAAAGAKTSTTSASSHSDVNNMPHGSNHNSKLYEMIGLACAGFLIVVGVIVTVVLLCKRRRNSTSRRFSQKSMETTATTTQNIDRTQLEVRDGVTSINNVMYDKLVANDTHIREADSRRGSCESNLDQDVKYPRKQSDCEHLLKKPSNLPSVSEAEKRKQRLSQLEDVYLAGNHFKKEDSTNCKRNKETRPLPPFPGANCRPAAEPPLSATFHKDRPPIPPPEAEKVNYYSTIQPIPEEGEITPAYMAITASQDGSFQRENVPEVAQYQSSNELHRPVAAVLEEETVRPAYSSINELSQNSQVTTSVHATPSNTAVAQYMSTEEVHRQASRESGTLESKSNFRKNKKISGNKKESQTFEQQTLLLPAMDKDGYLSMTSSENLHMSNEAMNWKNQLGTAADEYVSTDSTSQQDVRRHFAPRKKFSTPHAHAFAGSMPDLLSQKKQLQNEFLLPSKQVSADLLAKPMLHQYKQPRPSAPDIFIQCAYTSNNDLSHIRQRLERAADKSLLQSRGTPSDCSSAIAGGGSAESDLSNMYDRPALHGSNNSWGSSQPAFYDSPRPSLPSLFTEDFQKRF